MTNTESATEHIQKNTDGDFLCLCGNTPSDDGFYPINENNEEVEPTDADWKTNQYVCGRCGRIFDQDSLEVIRTVDLSSIGRLS